MTNVDQRPFLKILIALIVQAPLIAIHAQSVEPPNYPGLPDDSAQQSLAVVGRLKGAKRVNLPPFRRKNLRGFRSFRLNLSDLDFRESNLQNALFVGSDLRGCDFKGADLRGATLVGTKIQGAYFDQATRLPFSEKEAVSFGMIKARAEK